MQFEIIVNSALVLVQAIRLAKRSGNEKYLGVANHMPPEHRRR